MSDPLATLRPDFTRRYYDWCVAQVEAEVADDFGLLRRLRNSTALRYITWAEALDPAARRAFARSMLDRMFLHILPLLNLDPARADLQPAGRFLNTLGSVPPPILLAGERRRGEPHRKLSRGSLWRVLRADLEPLLGGFGSPRGGERIAATRCGAWTVVTRVDLGGSMRQVGYDHVVRTGPQANAARIWPFPISALSWLGVTGQTDLNDFDSDELPELAATMRDVCARFLNALPGLLDGLDPPAELA